MSRWSGRWPLILAAGAVLIAVAAGIGRRMDAGALAFDPYARPGRLAVLPDHRALNFRCFGHGSPTVILEAGFGAGSNAWGRVEPKIASVTRVCAYDRAGYGFSDPGPMPRDGEAIARDLDRGLKAARIAGPYVVVGHSAGGLYARLFAARRRRDVVGLVFVDTSVEHQPQRMAAMFGPGAGSIDGIRRRPARCLEVARSPKAPANAADLAKCAPSTLDAAARRVALRPDSWRTQLSELDTLFTTTSDEVDRTDTLLTDIPAIVLTAAKADGVAAAPEDRGAAAWQKFHHDFAASFHSGEQRLVKSSHFMMSDRPDVVADAAIELVRRARKR